MIRSIRTVIPAVVLSVAALGAMTLSGCASSASSDVDESSELRTRRTDAQVKAAIERAAEGALYASEADAPWTWVSADGRGANALTEQLVIEKLGSYVDNPDHEELHAKAAAFATFFDYDSCDDDSYPGPAECAKDKILSDAIKANLKKVKVFYVAPYENPTGDGMPTIFILGFTPEGNIGGVMTTAVWT